MSRQKEKAERFLSLHKGPGAFLIPNPWDAGSARVLAGAGFQALATSSAAAAAVLGQQDHSVTREEMMAHAHSIVNATDLPVSADLGKGFGDSPETVAETIRLAADAGLVGCTIEDATGDENHPLYDVQFAVERVAAAADAARALPFPFLVTARAHSFLFAAPSLDETIRRLQAFEKAGADVRSGIARSCRSAKRLHVRLEAFQLHGWDQREIIYGGRTRGGGSEADQCRYISLPGRNDGLS